jgi:hypothetical protein
LTEDFSFLPRRIQIHLLLSEGFLTLLDGQTLIVSLLGLTLPVGLGCDTARTKD